VNTTFRLDFRSAQISKRRPTAANQNASSASNNHSPEASNATLAGLRRAVDVAVVLGFRSTPQKESRFSLLLPRIPARAMACMTPGPFLQPGKMPVPELALQRSTVQQSNAQQVPPEMAHAGTPVIFSLFVPPFQCL
jgi:hypothetical protein